MGLIYKEATVNDIDILTETRIRQRDYRYFSRSN